MVYSCFLLQFINSSIDLIRTLSVPDTDYEEGSTSHDMFPLSIAINISPPNSNLAGNSVMSESQQHSFSSRALSMWPKFPHARWLKFQEYASERESGRHYITLYGLNIIECHFCSHKDQSKFKQRGHGNHLLMGEVVQF